MYIYIIILYNVTIKKIKRLTTLVPSQPFTTQYQIKQAILGVDSVTL